MMKPDMELTAADLRPLWAFAAGLDLEDAAAARAALESEFPVDGPFLLSLRASLEAGVADGSLCDKGAPPMRWSRLHRPGPETQGFSADVVLMSGAGPDHEHPRGEIDLCFPIDGEPRFDGQPAGWVVYPPGSRHVPTVSGGSMLILYLLPEGSFRLIES